MKILSNGNMNLRQKIKSTGNDRYVGDYKKNF